MHLVEQYALSCGVKIDQPHIEQSYYPTIHDKFITLHASSGMGSKNYDYYKDVIEMIIPYLQEQDIQIIQIGDKKDEKINGCIDYCGATNLKQSSYLINKALLHFGNDSFSAHVASGFDTKLVCLYSILYKECCGPYWGNKENQTLIESDRMGLKPSFSNKEAVKMVNRIKPEQVASAVLDLLEIPHTINNIETIHIGKEYHLPTISVIPNHVMPKSFAAGQAINILGDECFEPQNIAHWANNRIANIFIDQPIKIQYLKLIQKFIHQINYYVSMDTDISYINSIKNIGIKINLLCKDENILNDLKIKFFDDGVKLVKKKTKKDLDNIDLLCDNSRYKNSRKIISNGKIYSSKAAYSQGLEGDHDKIIDCDEFWEELDTIKIYNDTNTNSDR